MSAPFRSLEGGRLDRARPLRFTFDGRTYSGCQGDTLASALLAHGVHLVGRSFKYHRPRGILGAGADEPNALVGVGVDYDGLIAESQNRFLSLAFDVGEINDKLSQFIPAGFYYKTFMWPKRAWKSFYEPNIRAMAGLGKAPTAADGDRYTQRYAHCDVLVVGGGPAGLAAALAAASTGVKVILCDEQAEFGGSLLADTGATIEGKRLSQWTAEAVGALAAHGNVTLLPRTVGFGYFAHNFVGLAQRLADHLPTPDPGRPRERLWHVRAKQVVLATGPLERPLVFPDNDRPGVMLADAARTYLKRYGVKPGSRAVIATAHDEAYRAAIDLAQVGVVIEAGVDLRQEANGPLPAAAKAAGIKIMTGTVVTEPRVICVYQASGWESCGRTASSTTMSSISGSSTLRAFGPCSAITAHCSVTIHRPAARL